LQDLAHLTAGCHNVSQTIVLERGGKHVALTREKLYAFEEPLDPAEYLEPLYHLLIVKRLELQLLEGLQVRLRQELIFDGL
jgi:hypothetical protein